MPNTQAIPRKIPYHMLPLTPKTTYQYFFSEITSYLLSKNAMTTYRSQQRRKYGTSHQPMAWASALLGDAPPNMTPVSGSYLIARHLPWLQGALTTTS
jgi:hypothetical protein